MGARQCGLSKSKSEIEKRLPFRMPLSFFEIRESFSMALMMKSSFPVKVEIESIRGIFLKRR
jgi:hypothetical protein